MVFDKDYFSCFNFLSLPTFWKTMATKEFKGTPVKVLTDMPPRTFDLLTRYVEKFGWKDNLFAGKVKGEWVKYDGKTFCQLTDDISLGLLKLGIQKGDRIALVANNSPQWNMIDFAVQQVGAITIPIYSTISHNDYQFILNHSEAKIVFVEGNSIYKKISDLIDEQPSIQNVFSMQPVEGVKTLEDLMQLGRENTDLKDALKKVEDSIATDDVATIIYTSGTMGTPKGVMLSHRNLLTNFEFYSPHYPIDHTQTAVSYLPLSHIYERSVQYSHVYLGVSTYYVESIGTIMRDIADVKPEHFSTVPRVIEKAYAAIMHKGEKLTGLKKKAFFWAFDLADKFDETGRNNGWLYLRKLALADKLVFQEVKKAFGGNMRLIISGGASIQPRLVRTFAALGMPIVEGYGLTETSPVVCTNSLVTGKLKAGTVGAPCSNLDVKIDAETGEILVKGSSVMKGYYNDEVKTKEAIDENGYFHTGDKGEFDEDGLLKITGRIKEIFKDSMGKYISPALIENKFAESNWINAMMVVGENQKFAAALIVPNFDQVKQWCKENNIAYTTNAEMVENKIIITRFREEVDAYNKFFGDYEQVKRFKLLDHEWTVEDGELTPSLKIRRKVIAERYQNMIDSLFTE